jgi:hypothetical protein
VRAWTNGSAPDHWIRPDSFMADLIALTAEIQALWPIDLEDATKAGRVTGGEECLSP